MITLNVVGSYEGNEESKSYPGKVYVYIKPIAVPPAGFLRAVKCPKEYGAAADGMQKLGAFAFLCEPDKVPVVGIGEKIAASATLWPVMKPYWNKRENNVGYMREMSTVYILDGEVKPSNAKAVPASFSFKGYYVGAVRGEDGDITVNCQIEDAPPAWVIRETRVKKGVNFISAAEKLGGVHLSASAEHVPALPGGAPIETRGAVWPVISPYWDEESETVAIQKVPTPVFLVTHAIAAEKAKAGA
jgi:hypothetical protein